MYGNTFSSTSLNFALTEEEVPLLELFLEQSHLPA